jgi:hypothetical protein
MFSILWGATTCQPQADRALTKNKKLEKAKQDIVLIFYRNIPFLDQIFPIHP